MNEPEEQTQMSVRSPSASISIGKTGNVSLANIGDVLEIARLMSKSESAVPKHLRGNPGACLGVAIQASEWGISPYAAANKSYVVNDRLAYEAQLINAVILRRAPIKGRFKFAYQGEGEKRRCKVSVTCADGEEVSYESPEVGKIPVKNSPLWKGDPDQQLAYYSSRAMCRRHFPDVILGVYTPDEMEDEPRDVTPTDTTPHFLPKGAVPTLPAPPQDAQDEPEALPAAQDSPQAPAEAPETGSVQSAPIQAEDPRVLLGERMDEDAVRAAEVAKFLFDKGQIQNAALKLKGLPDEAVTYALDNWTDLVASVGGAA
jgi:hypothetical protein